MKRTIVFLLLVSAIMAASAVYPVCAQDFNIQWTEAELAFLAEHPVIRLGIDPGFVPFEFIGEQGQHVGIAADYLALISERTGLEFEVAQGLTWPEAYEAAHTDELDMLPAVSKTEEREKHFLFSQPYYHFKRVIVTQEGAAEISSLDDLQGHSVAVQRNSSHHSYLLSHPRINLSLYDSVESALAAVVTGEEKAFLGNLATTNYLIRTNALTNLRLVSFEAEKEQGVYFAVRQDWPELVSILDKALDTITEEEKLAIYNKWIDLRSATFDFRPLLRVGAAVAGLVILIMIISFYWIIKLRREVQRRIEIQAELERATQEAYEANQFKSNFLARMSHEIRTPLNAITGMAYLLKKTNLTLTQRMYADRITQAASVMLSIIDDILDYSKIEAGKVELEHSSFNLDHLIQDVVHIVLHNIEEQEIGFRLAKDPLVPRWFMGDQKRIKQVLLNILNNAAKFTAEGEISLDIRLLAKEQETYHLTFAIKDTGIGMDQEQMERLFSPFVQGDSSINRRFGGSGLGLSIVKNLVDLMGGQIQVFSTPKEGSTVIVHLSLPVDKTQEDEYMEALAGEPFKHVRTLVLEKSGANMNLIESYLSEFGIHCELTTSPASALAMLEAADGKFAKPFDLVIVDYDTPKEGGFKFVEEIRSSSKIVKTPKFIMLLPLMREDLFDRLDEYEVDIGIGKPIIPSILLNALLDLFSLKAVAAAGEVEVARGELPPLDKEYTVLVVEDNRTNQLLAQSLLQQIGIRSVLAANGQEAVEIYRQQRQQIALILMDLHMPVMNGYEAAERIRELSASVPIVAMTADVVLGVREKCAESGIYHYISKPFDPEHLLATVRTLLLADGQWDVKPKQLDEGAGLKHMGGSAKIYEKVLAEYFSENQDTAEKLQLAVKEKRYGDAAQIVHKIKGSSGSIGAQTLFEISTQLYRALTDQKEERIEALAKEFGDTLTALLDEIVSR